MKGILYLEDGKVFKGKLFGYSQKISGELIFDTRVVGYQEVITDPSYLGKIVLFTYPLIGNYGINPEDSLSEKSRVSGIVVKEISKIYSNFRAKEGLPEFMKKNKITGISNIDTQEITHYLRNKGSQSAGISPDGSSIKELIKDLKGIPRKDLVKEATCSKPYFLEKGDKRVSVLDLGIRKSDLNLLLSPGFSLKVFPANTSSKELLQDSSGLFISSGPGSPESISHTLRSVKESLGKIPIFAFGLGHLVLGLALGGKISKLKAGHFGVNQPVREIKTNKLSITSQSHNFVLNNEFSDKRVKITYLNLNDGTVEGIEAPELKAFSLQFSPSLHHFEKWRKYV